MTTTNQAARLGTSDLQRLLSADQARLFETEAATPCRVGSDADKDLWFSPFRDRERAARRCLDCPFLGRCGYNAVATRATHGVWGGEVFPGDFAEDLEPIYTRLLEQFERRRDIELGDTPAPALPDITAIRRRRRAA
jgi:WhiB family redox-sensing transcriptional regulator